MVFLKNFNVPVIQWTVTLHGGKGSRCDGVKRWLPLDESRNFSASDIKIECFPEKHLWRLEK